MPRRKNRKEHPGASVNATAVANEEEEFAPEAEEAEEDVEEVSSERPEETQVQDKVPYHRTEKGRAAHMTYAQSEKGQEARKRYQDSEKGKAARKRWQNSEKGKAAMAKYRKTRAARLKAERDAVAAAAPEAVLSDDEE